MLLGSKPPVQDFIQAILDKANPATELSTSLAGDSFSLRTLEASSPEEDNYDLLDDSSSEREGGLGASPREPEQLTIEEEIEQSPIVEGTGLTLKEVKESCITSYSTFCRLMQDDDWFDPVHERICDEVQKEIERQWEKNEVAYIGIVLPRGTLKTTIFTKYLPVWLTLLDSHTRSLIATNTHPNACKKVGGIRGLFDTHKLFRTLFPELLPDDTCKWTDISATIKRPFPFDEGTFEGCGMKTRVTGRHYNNIIEDDTTSPNESETTTEIMAPTKEDVDRAIGWHKTATALLVPKGKRVRMVVSTRWADLDLIDHIKRNEPNYRIFDVPALDSVGNPNFSMFYSKKELDTIRMSIGEYMFACLYLNAPLDASKRVFKDEWINNSWVESTTVPSDGFVSLAIDPAISEKDEACETAITACRHILVDKTQSFQWWLRDLHGHMNPKELVDTTLDLAKQLGAKYIIVETVAYQAAIQYALRDEMIKRGVRYAILEFNSHQKKEERIFGLEPMFANSRIKMVKGGLTPQVESQLRQFPNGRLVDIIDCFSMHRRVYRGEKMVENVSTEPMDAEDTFMFELNKLREKYAKKQGKGGLDTGLGNNYNPFGGLSTGLGTAVDRKLMFSEMGRN